MTKNRVRTLVGAGFIAAISASLCCLAPILVLFAGTSGFASTVSWIQPFRPLFIVVNLAVIGYAWYRMLRSQKSEACGCELGSQRKMMRSKLLLSFATACSILMLGLPYFQSNHGQTLQDEDPQQSGSHVTVEFRVAGMTCSSCEQHVQQEVLKLDGVSQAAINYYEGTAAVEYDSSKTDPAAIAAAIRTTGYTVTDLQGK